MRPARRWRAAQAAAILLVAATGVCAALAESRIRTVDVRGIAFMPSRLVAHVNDTIVWHNADFVAHTATSKEADFDVDLPPGQEGSTRLTKAGRFTYICRYHPNMRATLTVEP